MIAPLQVISSRRGLGRLALLLVFGMAVACLWPFVAPKNTASWTSGGNAVAFGKHGILVGSGPLRPNDVADSGCTLDLWVAPDPADDEGMILASFTPANPRLLRIEQFRDGLAVRSSAVGDPVRTGGAQLYVGNVFAPGKTALLTLTSNEWGTRAFVNGIFRRAAPNFRICHALLTGRLVAGTAADSHFAWRGRLMGIAVFGRLLTPEQIQADFKACPYHAGPAFGSGEDLIALYPFDDGRGDRVRDEVSGSNSFYMPDRYVVPAQRLLSPPSFDNYSDILANVIGFMPLGFTLCAYFLSFRWGDGTSIVVTVLLCGVFSLILETLQWFLPTRDSDMTDVITNTVGAAAGALFCRLRRIRAVISRPRTAYES
jgi:VanZ family protein